MSDTDEQLQQQNHYSDNNDDDNDNDTTTQDNNNATTNTPTNDIQLTEEAQRKLAKYKAKQIEKLQIENAKLQQRGIVYISSIPPHMNSTRLKQLLSQYNNAIIHRIYLRPAKGTRTKQYIDGWIEFDDKSIAKSLVNMLNGERIMSNNRRDLFYDCIWNLRYLKGFKWNHLNDKKHAEKAIQQSKLRETMKLAHNQAEEYYNKVKQANYIRRKQLHNYNNVSNNTNDNTQQQKPRQRQFKQRVMLDNTITTDNIDNANV